MIETLYQIYLDYPQVCTDSRSAQKNQIFFALQGNQFNGNHFAYEALKKGCAYAVVDDPAYYQPNHRYILVENTLHTLQQLANFHRHKLDIPVIAITGSNGKTTTKELLATILRQRYRCHATIGNLNNHIGTALSLLAIPLDAEVAVLEMGANHRGEIMHLCEIVEPTHGLITNIGYAHIEGFGGIEGVIKGKSELYDYLNKTGGIIFINSTDVILMEKVKMYHNSIIYYPQQGDFYTADFISSQPYLIYKNQEGKEITTHLLGKHHFSNVAAAGCIATYMGVDSSTIDRAIQSYIPINNRSQTIRKGSSIIVLDAYNANPTSMRAALEAFYNLSMSYKVVILGNMNELGKESINFHKQIVTLTAQYKYQEVLLYGSDMKEASLSNPQAICFKDRNELIVYLQNRTFRDTAFLIKGSHTYNMENLLPYIISA
jgi:UDP-N-acetylmuramoyl-tripeptide--D-alanyl-D-alanine ligase